MSTARKTTDHSAGQELETWIRNHFKKNEPAAPGSNPTPASSASGSGGAKA